jgi:cytochrome c peroxidase
VEMYNRGGDDKSNLSPEMKKLELSDREIDDVVAFLKTLSGKPVQVTLPQLPY